MKGAELQRQLVKELTDDFVSAFEDPSEDYSGGFAQGIAAGLTPLGVDFKDPRVIEIVRRCKEATKP